jgi:iron-sulfur cluster assembly accessory protein
MSCCNPYKKKEEENPHSHSNSGGCCSQPKREEEKKNSSCCSSAQAEPKEITRQMTIENILGMFPNKAQKLAQEITNAGLHCIGCHAAVWETLEAGMMTHGKNDEQIDELVRRLNALLAEKADDQTISITTRAAAKFLEILAEEGKQGWGMRFAEELAGCNGFEFVLDFSEQADEDDEIFLSNGIEIHVKKAMVPRLLGSEIDFVDGLRGSGFKISNPNVRSACGCGTSHNY